MFFIIMRRIKAVSFVLPILLFTINCSGSGSPIQPLTRENNRNLFKNPAQNQKQLKLGTLYGCVHVPATGFIQNLMVGFEKTGESCSITISENNMIQVSFLGDNVIPIVSTSTDQHRTDTFIGELDNNQPLIVQHQRGEVVSVTQTIYDENGDVVYGKSGKGQWIKSCNLTMTTSERLAGKKDCRK